VKCGMEGDHKRIYIFSLNIRMLFFCLLNIINSEMAGTFVIVFEHFEFMEISSDVNFVHK
jgi:hypothetical protein